MVRSAEGTCIIVEKRLGQRPSFLQHQHSFLDIRDHVRGAIKPPISNIHNFEMTNITVYVIRKIREIAKTTI
jgi:hypothetical protein